MMHSFDTYDSEPSNNSAGAGAGCLLWALVIIGITIVVTFTVEYIFGTEFTFWEWLANYFGFGK